MKRLGASTAGFLLPSFIVYAAILTMLVAVTVRLAVVVLPVNSALVQWCSYTQFYTAYDMVCRELAHAPADSMHWHKADVEGFIWNAGTSTKGLLIMHDNLIYKEGAYNATSQEWFGTRTSLLARGCTFVTAGVTKQGARVQDVYCQAELIANPGHTWRYRHFYG